MRIVEHRRASSSIVVYQAYRPEIGDFSVEHQHFGGAFSYNRMTWIKPNFLWMMYHSGLAGGGGAGARARAAHEA